MVGFNTPGYSGSYYPNIGRAQLLFADLDPNMVEAYRRNRIGLNTVQVTGILAIKQNV
jgi:hypothetical protein